MISIPASDQDRRRDPLLRQLVQQCMGSLGQRGFRLAQRGGSDDHRWVRLRRPARDPSGVDSDLMVLVAHGQRERTVMVDAYFVDTALGAQAPWHKLLHRYAPESELPGVVREVAHVVEDWRA
jgi:hypothetical protein